MLMTGLNPSVDGSFFLIAILIFLCAISPLEREPRLYVRLFLQVLAFLTRFMGYVPPDSSRRSNRGDLPQIAELVSVVFFFFFCTFKVLLHIYAKFAYVRARLPSVRMLNPITRACMYATYSLRGPSLHTQFCNSYIKKPLTEAWQFATTGWSDLWTLH
jgi:hypothetical protein